jgi:hypothetical protein
VSQREYLAVCAAGHRSYLRLDLIPAEGKPPAKGRCVTCGQPAGLVPLGPPGTVTHCGRLRPVHWPGKGIQ